MAASDVRQKTKWPKDTPKAELRAKTKGSKTVDGLAIQYCAAVRFTKVEIGKRRRKHADRLGPPQVKNRAE